MPTIKKKILVVNEIYFLNWPLIKLEYNLFPKQHQSKKRLKTKKLFFFIILSCINFKFTIDRLERKAVRLG